VTRNVNCFADSYTASSERIGAKRSLEQVLLGSKLSRFIRFRKTLPSLLPSLLVGKSLAGRGFTKRRGLSISTDVS